MTFYREEVGGSASCDLIITLAWEGGEEFPSKMVNFGIKWNVNLLEVCGIIGVGWGGLISGFAYGNYVHLFDIIRRMLIIRSFSLKIILIELMLRMLSKSGL